MKKLVCFFCTVQLIVINISSLSAQCPGGTSAASINWDYLDYFVTTGTYAPGATGPYSLGVTSAVSRNQKFAIGVNYFTISVPTLTIAGENTTHTGEAGSFGTGADVQYSGNGSITITFNDSVYNVRFSLYDIDISQVATVTALNPSSVPLNITMAKANAAATFVITGNGTPSAVATAPATSYALTSNLATANITVPGTVKSVTITMTGTAGDVFLSDISACVTGSFSTNYFQVARPFTGMPAYGLATSDSNIIHVINLATGVAIEKFLEEPANKWINGLSYDPHTQNMYYIQDSLLASSLPNAPYRILRKYDYNTETKSVFIPDVNTLGIVTFERGMKSAGSAFYDGDIYVGVEGIVVTDNANRENVIWRIDLDASGSPVSACQVFAQLGESGGVNQHNWADFVIRDGVIYDFDQASAVAQSSFFHYNLQTGAMVSYAASSINRPRQNAPRWDGTIFNIYDDISVYNENGTLGTKTLITGYAWIGSSTDASGPFRPKCDFGDAPATYDPDPLSPAVHEKDTAIRIGATWDREMNKTSSVPADADGADEDGLAYVPVFSPGAGNYLAQVSVYNNTGVTATLIAWLDYNGNGIFDASEACQSLAPIASMPTLQNRFLYWPSAPTSLPNGSYTYLRIRLVRATTGMTSSNPTGYYNHGETEDYRVLVDNFPLSVNMLSFNAKVFSNKNIQLDWKTSNEENLSGFTIQRSKDITNWSDLGAIVNATGNSSSSVNEYIYNDLNPLKGNSYYRLAYVSKDGKISFSEVKSVVINEETGILQVFPNPVKDKLTIRVNNTSSISMVQIIDIYGKILCKYSYNNCNQVVIPVHTLSKGVYIFTVKDKSGNFFIEKIIKQ